MKEGPYYLIGQFVFAVQRLKGCLVYTSRWMRTGAMQHPADGKELVYSECMDDADAYFAARGGSAALRDAFLRVIEAVRQLEATQVAFLASAGQIDIRAHLGEVASALGRFADVALQLDYPGARDDALALRSDAAKCEALGAI